MRCVRDVLDGSVTNLRTRVKKKKNCPETNPETGKSCDAVAAGTNRTETNMALSLVFFALMLVPCFLGSDALVGGIEERKTDDPEVLDALDFAMNEFNAMQNNMYRLMATKVEDATFQVSL